MAHKLSLVLAYLASSCPLANARSHPVTGVALLERRDEIADRPDFVGYYYVQANPAYYTPDFCDTGATWTVNGNSEAACCDVSSGALCGIGTTCSGVFIYGTYAANTAFYTSSCGGFDPMNACKNVPIYNSFGETTYMSYFACRDSFFGTHPYYRTPPAGANVVTTSLPTYSPAAPSTSASSMLPRSTTRVYPETSSASSPIIPSSRSSTSIPTTSSLSSSLSTPFSPSSSRSSSSSISTAASESSPQTTGTPSAGPDSSSGLNSSDKIALGIGLGIGIPTVIIGILTWCYPRRRNFTIQHSGPPIPEVPKESVAGPIPEREAAGQEAAVP